MAAGAQRRNPTLCSGLVHNGTFQRINTHTNQSSLHWNKERHFPHPCQILCFLPPAVSTIDVFKKRPRFFFFLIMRKVFVLISSEKNNREVNPFFVKFRAELSGVFWMFLNEKAYAGKFLAIHTVAIVTVTLVAERNLEVEME